MAKEGQLELLAEASELEPRPSVGSAWKQTHTYFDTSRLLRSVEESEPTTQKALEERVEQVVRQARWHALLATVWNVHSWVVLDANQRPDAYSDADRKELGEIDLTKIDEDATPAAERNAEKQITLETLLEGIRRQLLALYKAEPEGDPVQIPGPAGPAAAVKLGAMTSDDLVRQHVAPAFKPAVPVPGRDVIEAPHPAAASFTERVSTGFRATPGWLRALTTRDLLWSVAIVIVALAVYVPSFYGPTWGNLGDYATAFIAGFVGKVAVNWALLPAFRSLNLGGKPPPVKELLSDAAAAAG